MASKESRQGHGSEDGAFHAPRHAVRLKKHRALRGFSLVLTTLALVGVSGIATAYSHFSSLVTTTDDLSNIIAAPTVARTPDPEDPNAGQAVNIVVMGVDDRSGANGDVGAGTTKDVGTSQRSDTTMLVHISGDRTRVEVISIPRDSWVQIPACALDLQGTKMSKPTSNKFNASFATGANAGKDVTTARELGAACVVSTINSLTGLNIQDYAIVDFAGFEQMVNAVGGVEMDIPEQMTDAYTGLDLQPGVQTLNGEQALQYVRARHIKGSDGSDLNRINNQQQFVSALASKVLSQGVLSNPSTLRDFVNAAASSLTVSPGLSGNNLIGLAYSLRNIKPENIQFLMVPVASKGDGSNVVWTSQADDMWQSIAEDQPVTGTLDANGNDPSQMASATPSASPTPSTTGQSAAKN